MDSDRYADQHENRTFFLLMKHSTLPKLHKDSSTLLGLPAKIVKLPYHAVKSFV